MSSTPMTSEQQKHIFALEAITNAAMNRAREAGRMGLCPLQKSLTKEAEQLLAAARIMAEEAGTWEE